MNPPEYLGFGRWEGVDPSFDEQAWLDEQADATDWSPPETQEEMNARLKHEEEANKSAADELATMFFGLTGVRLNSSTAQRIISNRKFLSRWEKDMRQSPEAFLAKRLAMDSGLEYYDILRGLEYAGLEKDATIGLLAASLARKQPECFSLLLP